MVESHLFMYLSASADLRESLGNRCTDGNTNFHRRQIPRVHEIRRHDLETSLQRNDLQLVAALQTDLEQIHVLLRQVLVCVDVREAPDHGGEDSQDVSLSRQPRSEAEALLLQTSGRPSGAKLSRRVVKRTRQSLSARHLLSALGSSEVDLHASVELAQRSVEELADGGGAAVAAGACCDALLVSGELTLQEEADLLGHLVGDEVGDRRRHGDLVRGGGRGRKLVPRVLVSVDLRGQEKVVDEELEDGLLVGGGRVSLHEGDNLLHGVVEEGGANLGEVGLNCGDGVCHF